MSFRTLSNADGSATYVAPNKTHTIIAGVNYPVEVPYRSDELPDSTYIEVNLRPHNAVGMVKERHVESLVKSTLQAIVRNQDTPRMMLQVTLQVANAESDEHLPGGVKGGGQGETYLPVLTSAINAAVLGCLDGAVQMEGLAAAVLIAISRDGSLIDSPNVAQQKKCQSLHVFAFAGSGDAILVESEGSFNMEHWEQALNQARETALGPNGLIVAMKQAIGQRVAHDQRWQG